MTAFTVIAANKFFFQKFAVVAADKGAAHRLVEAELARTVSGEDEEYEDAVRDEAGKMRSEPRPVDRADHVYVVQERQTEVEDGDGDGEPSIRFVDSGGNG